jgi:hypothetical protein
MKVLSLRRALRCAALAACVVVGTAAFVGTAAAARVKAGTVPATIVLPSGWTSSGASSGGVRFNASSTKGYGRLQVTAGGSFPTSLPYSVFVQTEVSTARATYRHEDPKASVSGKKVTFPSGPAVEITATVNHAGAALSFVIFSFLHKGVTYHFTFFTNPASIGSLRSSFEASARSITFA